MLITVASTPAELSLRSDAVWENDRAVGGGSAVQTLTAHAFEPSLVAPSGHIIQTSRAGDSTGHPSVAQPKGFLPSGPPTAPQHIPVSLRFPASPYSSNLSFCSLSPGFKFAAKQKPANIAQRNPRGPTCSHRGLLNTHPG